MKHFLAASFLAAALSSGEAAPSSAYDQWWNAFQTKGKEIQDGVQNFMTNVHSTFDGFDGQINQNLGKFMNGMSGLDFGQQCDCEQRCQDDVQRALQPLTRNMRVRQALNERLTRQNAVLKAQLETKEEKVLELTAMVEKHVEELRARSQDGQACSSKATFNYCREMGSFPQFAESRRRRGPLCATVLGVLFAVATVIAMHCWLTSRAVAKRLEAVKIQAEVKSCSGSDDHPFTIEDDKVGAVTLRRVRLECPGVAHDEIQVEGLCNGCLVTVLHTRKGLSSTWSKRVQFRPSEGLFEFQEDLAELELGILTLVFRASTSPPWTFNFPQHFDMDKDDKQMAWMLSTDSDVPVATEPSHESTTEPAEEPSDEDPSGDGQGDDEHDDSGDVHDAPEQSEDDDSEIDTNGSDIESEAPSLLDFEKL